MTIPERSAITEGFVYAVRSEVDRAVDPRFTLLQEELDRRFIGSDAAVEAALVAADKAVQVALSAVDQRFNALQLQIDQRFTGSDKAVQVALHVLEERFTLVQDEIDRRFTGADTAVAYALTSADKAVQAALKSAELATSKAEMASEKRFDCVASDVLILCADLTWRPAGDLLVGDELITVDESSPSRRGRRFRKAVVTANSLARDSLLRVVTPQGSVRCNYHHPWLAQRRERPHTWEWLKAEDLRPGDVVMHAVDVWDVDRSWDAGWLAGMYDGEGCLSFHANGTTSQLSMAQRVSPTADRMIRLLKERVGSGNAYLTDRRPYQPQYHFVVSAHADVMKLLGSIRPPRLLAEAERVWDGRVIGGRHRVTTVTAVEGAGTGMIAQLSTSTHTYIGAGFVMHNSVNEFRQTLSDQTKSFVTQDKFSGLDSRVDDIRDRITTVESLTRGIQSVTGSGYDESAFRQTDSIAKQVASRAQLALLLSGFTGVVAMISLVVVIILHKLGRRGDNDEASESILVGRRREFRR